MNTDIRSLTQSIAAANLTQQSIARIHQEHIQRLPDRIAKLQQEVKDLRRQIKEAGIGQKPDLENRYLEALDAARVLEQSWAMAQQDQPISQPDKPSSDLQKAIDYAELLLEIYQPGVLIKGASADIQAIVRKLEGYENDRARQLINALLQLQRNH
jgi:uncharacterized protein (UPF0335 family)